MLGIALFVLCALYWPAMSMSRSSLSSVTLLMVSGPYNQVDGLYERLVNTVTSRLVPLNDDWPHTVLESCSHVTQLVHRVSPDRPSYPEVTTSTSNQFDPHI